MSAFVLLSSSAEKRGQVYPTILEFVSDEALQTWLDAGGQERLDHWAEDDADAFGGWPTAHILMTGCGEDPDEWSTYRDEITEEREATLPATS